MEMLEPIRTVAVGTSLGPASDAVVGKALELARAAGARLHLVHASILPLPYAGDPFLPWVDETAIEAQQKELRERLEQQIDRLGIDRNRELAGTTLEPGAAHQVILEAARRADARLVVVGYAEGNGKLERLLGSTADRVLRKATRPVLVLRGDLPVPPRRVLIPVDLSPLAADAFRCGLDFLIRIAGAPPPKVEALLVLEPYPRQMPYQFTHEEARVMAAHELRRFIAGGGEAAQEVWSNIRTGEPRAEILAELDDWPADLVVLGTHGRSGLERFVLGSVAASVARDASCSALVIPPEAALRAALAAA
jgi:nucleotide-binding universal stress UspA family protein